MNCLTVFWNLVTLSSYSELIQFWVHPQTSGGAAGGGHPGAVAALHVPSQLLQKSNTRLRFDPLTGASWFLRPGKSYG